MGFVTSDYVILVPGLKWLTWCPHGAGSDRVAEVDSSSGLTREGLRVGETSPGAWLEGEGRVHIEGGTRHPATRECVCG